MFVEKGTGARTAHILADLTLVIAIAIVIATLTAVVIISAQLHFPLRRHFLTHYSISFHPLRVTQPSLSFYSKFDLLYACSWLLTWD